MTVAVDFTRLAAPSRQSLAAAGFSTVMRKGQVPSCRVVVAIDDKGGQWVHFKVFMASEGNVAKALSDKVEQVGKINPAHWRKCDKREY